YGELGLGYTNNQISTVTELPLSGVKNIVCGRDYTFFMMDDGSIRCCGSNSQGQLGLDHTKQWVSMVTDLPFSGVKNIVCGGKHTFFIMDDGSIKCCGYNHYGELGLGHTNNPVSTVTALPLSGVKNIVCGYYQTFFIMDDESIKCCGANFGGQLGLGHTNNPVPTATDLPFTGINDFNHWTNVLIRVYDTDPQIITGSPINTFNRSGINQMTVTDSTPEARLLMNTMNMTDEGALGRGKLWSVPIPSHMRITSMEVR
ncbi:MAG: hypothetical protein MJB12_00640, partial [Firmicutes bacterium]|nr:hypothetical protein [Bacillota bacterium]